MKKILKVLLFIMVIIIFGIAILFGFFIYNFEDPKEDEVLSDSEYGLVVSKFNEEVLAQGKYINELNDFLINNYDSIFIDSHSHRKDILVCQQNKSIPLGINNTIDSLARANNLNKTIRLISYAKDSSVKLSLYGNPKTYNKKLYREFHNIYIRETIPTLSHSIDLNKRLVKDTLISDLNGQYCIEIEPYIGW